MTRIERDFVREANKTALVSWLKTYIKVSRRLQKRCGLTPTESLLFKLSWGLKELLVATRSKVFTIGFMKKITKRMGEVFTDDPCKTDEIVKKIKIFINSKVGNTLFEYSLSKLKGLFNSEAVTKILTPAALKKHRDTLGVPVDVLSKDEIARVTKITEALISGAKYDIYRVPSLAVKSCLEKPLCEGGKKQALYENCYRVFKSTGKKGSDESYRFLPTIVVTSEDGARSILFSEGWAVETICSAAEPWNRDEVAACAVPGPLKARIITKETAGNQFLEFVRRGIWEALRRQKMFLIDRPVGVEDIAIRGPGEFYVSGDYTAATDGFHPEVSEAILGVIADHVGNYFYEFGSDRMFGDEYDEGKIDMYDMIPRLRQIIKNTMTNKTILYPGGESIHQNRGQLMGNLLSFPVLCIYNYCVFHISLEDEVGKSLPLQERVRINGDDICFPATMRRYLNWKEHCDSLGLELNELKTQLHWNRCNLNSRLFSERDGVLREVYAHSVFDVSVTREDRRDLRKRDLERCGLDAPGSGLFFHELSAPREESTRCLPFPCCEDVLFNSLFVTTEQGSKK